MRNGSNYICTKYYLCDTQMPPPICSCDPRSAPGPVTLARQSSQVAAPTTVVSGRGGSASSFLSPLAASTGPHGGPGSVHQEALLSWQPSSAPPLQQPPPARCSHARALWQSTRLLLWCVHRYGVSVARAHGTLRRLYVSSTSPRVHAGPAPPSTRPRARRDP